MLKLKTILISLFVMSYILVLPMNVLAKQNLQERSVESQQIDMLKEQNKILKESSNQLLSVILWSLGFAALFLLVYLGVNWFVAFRLHEKDKENIRAELVTMVHDLMREESSALSKTLQEKFDDKMKTIDQRQSQFESSSDKKLQDLQDKFAKSISDAMKACQSNINGVRDLAIDLKYQILQWTADEWKANVPPVLENALSDYIEMLDLACTYNMPDWKINILLDKILETVKQIDKLSAETIAQLEAALSSVPQKYRPVADNIKRSVRH